MRVWMLLGVAGALLCAPPAAAFNHVLSRNGRVGDLQVSHARTDQVRSKEGRPSRIVRGTGEGGVAVTEWRYGCGGSRHSSYFFNATGVLVNFVTTCRSWHTADGTRVGDSQVNAEEQEGKRAAPASCGDGTTIVRRGKAELS
jgi:hypothetical protein